MKSTGEGANGAARRGAGRSGMAVPGVGLRDVAQAVGVSTATVSRAINRPEVVSAELRERIAAAIAELGWIPDGAARALTTGDRRRSGPCSRHSGSATSPCRQRHPAPPPGTGLHAAPRLFRIRPGAGVPAGPQVCRARGRRRDPCRPCPPSRPPPFLEQRKLPFISSFVYDPARPGRCVGPDNHKALVRMTDYLADLGHVRFAVIAQATENNDRASARLSASETHSRCGALRCAPSTWRSAPGRSRRDASSSRSSWTPTRVPLPSSAATRPWRSAPSLRQPRAVSGARGRLDRRIRRHRDHEPPARPRHDRARPGRGDRHPRRAADPRPRDGPQARLPA